MSLEIRLAERPDLPRVGELTAHAYLADGILDEADEYVHELRDAHTRADEAHVLVAVDDGVVVGTITLAGPTSSYAEIAGEGEWELRMLAVDPGVRGRGVGERLLRAAMERAEQDGARAVVLSTLPVMQAAQRMYDRIGLHRRPDRDWSIEGYDMLVYATEPA